MIKLLSLLNQTLEEEQNPLQQLSYKINRYRIPYKKFNHKIKTEWIPLWKEEYNNDIAKINELVARYLLYQISEDLFGGVEEIEFANKSKNPTNHFQMNMYLGDIILWTSPFIYVDNNHKVIAKKIKIEILNNNYDTIGILKEDKEGEKRAKYPSCRPTASQCKTPGKGTKWGKTK